MMISKAVISRFLPVFALVFFGVASAQDDSADSLELTFGVYQSSKATVMYRQFSPVIDAIQLSLEDELRRPVDIHIKIFRSYDEGNYALVAGDVDFVRFGPASYLIAKSRNPDIRLLVMESKKGQKRFSGIIAVRPDSAIQTLADLAGKKFAFGDQNSTIGRYLAQAELQNAGVTSSDLASYQYLGRHDTVGKAVAIGDYDAGSLKESTFETFRRAGELRELHRFQNVTQPWIARGHLDQEVFDAIQHSLLSLEDPEALEELGVTGFFPTSDSEYEFIRQGMLSAVAFEN